VRQDCEGAKENRFIHVFSSLQTHYIRQQDPEDVPAQICFAGLNMKSKSSHFFCNLCEHACFKTLHTLKVK